ncbi:MAG TPA: glycerophosphodiester phosphodiesterase [Longimicrobiales bacterium]|nr:glycerophosphodiester phosphodiesterase [Longimicrobiales bacterium]
MTPPASRIRRSFWARLLPAAIERHSAFPRRPLLVAHRGGGALAPENTLAAFRAAVERWEADAVELDVHASADGHCVVIHDPTVERTTDGSGAVADLTLEELRRLDAGYRFSPDGGRTFPFRAQGVRIPTFPEVLRALPDTPLVVELKTAAAQEPLRRAMREAGCEARVCVAGERNAFVAALADHPGPRSTPREPLLRFFLLQRLGLARLWRPAAHAAHIPETFRGVRAVTPAMVRALHERGLAVYIWTVNDPADMRRLLDWGVDGILSDRPDLLARVLHERVGRPLPPGLAGAE